MNNLLYREHIILVESGKCEGYWNGGKRFQKLRDVVDFIDRSLGPPKSLISKTKALITGQKG
jgi:hypothetical protein